MLRISRSVQMSSSIPRYKRKHPLNDWLLILPAQPTTSSRTQNRGTRLLLIRTMHFNKNMLPSLFPQYTVSSSSPRLRPPHSASHVPQSTGRSLFRHDCGAPIFRYGFATSGCHARTCRVIFIIPKYQLLSFLVLPANVQGEHTLAGKEILLHGIMFSVFRFSKKTASPL